MRPINYIRWWMSTTSYPLANERQWNTFWFIIKPYDLEDSEISELDSITSKIEKSHCLFNLQFAIAPCTNKNVDFMLRSIFKSKNRIVELLLIYTTSFSRPRRWSLVVYILATKFKIRVRSTYTIATCYLLAYDGLSIYRHFNPSTGCKDADTRLVFLLAIFRCWIIFSCKNVRYESPPSWTEKRGSSTSQWRLKHCFIFK